jgi:hypothetical protein
MIRRHDRAMPPGVGLVDATVGRRNPDIAGNTVFLAIT